MRFKDFLLEMFDSPANWEWEVKSASGMEAKAVFYNDKLKRDVTYYYTFTRAVGQSTWRSEFTLESIHFGNRYKKTMKSGESVKALVTYGDVILAFLEMKTPDKLELVDTQQPSRLVKWERFTQYQPWLNKIKAMGYQLENAPDRILIIKTKLTKRN